MPTYVHRLNDECRHERKTPQEICRTDKLNWSGHNEKQAKTDENFLPNLEMMFLNTNSVKSLGRFSASLYES